jgi:hypothetical protein
LSARAHTNPPTLQPGFQKQKKTNKKNKANKAQSQNQKHQPTNLNPNQTLP